jgi:hypothetical protein
MIKTAEGMHERLPGRRMGCQWMGIGDGRYEQRDDQGQGAMVFD